MEINLKSSAGRTFNVLFDPVTVILLMSLVTLSGANAERRHTILRIDDSVKNDELSDEFANRLESFALELSQEKPPIDPKEPLEAFEDFRREYELLSSGAGSERACMEAFWRLCELLQGV